MSLVSSTFHFLLMVHFIYVIYYDLFVLELDETYKKNAKIGLGELKYLTFWNLLFQCGYYIIAFANDVFGTEEKYHKHQSVLQKRRDFLFSTIGFSVSTFVCVVFWGLYYVDRKLIFPVEMDEWFPSWLNHGMHSVPIIAVFCEVWLVNHKFPKRLIGVITVLILIMLYLLWTCFIAYYWDGFWVYPFLRDRSMAGRAIVIAFCSLVLVVFYFPGEFLHNLAWRRQEAKNKAQ